MNIKISKLLIVFSVCTGLPESWTNVTTGSEFPISHDTTLAVSCQEDYKNTGSDVLTCNTYLYDDYSYTLEPQCVLGKRFEIFILIQISNSTEIENIYTLQKDIL